MTIESSQLQAIRERDIHEVRFPNDHTVVWTGREASFNAAADRRALLSHIDSLAAPQSITQDQIHTMCHYIRGASCKKCPATVDTLYGNGQPGCHAVAEETLKQAIAIAGPSVSGVEQSLEATADELQALEESAYTFDCEAVEEASKAGRYQPGEYFSKYMRRSEIAANSARTLRSLAARLSPAKEGGEDE